MVILSDVEGLFTADPRLSSQASLVEEVKDRSGDEEMAGEKVITFLPGMKSKIIAARMATLSGIG